MEHEGRARAATGDGPRFLVVLDVDSTLVHEEVIDLLADAAGSRDEVADVTERAMRGELDFAESLRARVATLAGLDSAVIDSVRRSLHLTAGAETLIDAVHGSGGAIGVVSGGFHEVLDPLASSLGLDRWRANRLGVLDGRLTGAVDGDIVDADAKAAFLAGWAEEHGLSAARTVAVGDGANDLEMMRRAGLSVAFCSKPAVRRHADVVMDRRDLAQLVPLLGLER